MKASAPSVLAQESLLGSAARLRAGLIGSALGALALTASGAIAVLIAAGPFHTSLGRLA